MGNVIPWRGRRALYWKAKLTEDDVVLIKQLLNEGLSTPVIAEKFEVSRSMIWRIKVGMNWKHVPDQEINHE